MRRIKRPGSIPLPQRNVALAVPLPLPPPSSSSSAPAASSSSTNISAAKSLSELERVGQIGSGAGGTVYKVIHRPTSRLFALKVINATREEKVRRQICREVEILRSVDHPNIVKCHDMFDHDDQVHILLEFMDNGSLEGAHLFDSSQALSTGCALTTVVPQLANFPIQ